MDRIDRIFQDLQDNSRQSADEILLILKNPVNPA
jgi:hypothetical protein